MRVFLGVVLPKEVKDYLYNLQKKFKGARVNWTAKKNLHLTLNFLGDMKEDKIEELTEVIKQIKYKPFKVKLSPIGFFPDEKAIKIIWVGLEPKVQVLKFAHTIDAEIMQFTKEQRFEAHITLGRMRGFKKEKDFFKSIKENKIEPIEFEINSFQLFKSVLSKDGPKYFTLENVEMS